jgi:hypothetical protein
METKRTLRACELEKIRRQLLKELSAYRRELERKLKEIEEDGTDHA